MERRHPAKESVNPSLHKSEVLSIGHKKNKLGVSLLQLWLQQGHHETTDAAHWELLCTTWKTSDKAKWNAEVERSCITLFVKGVINVLILICVIIGWQSVFT